MECRNYFICSDILNTFDNLTIYQYNYFIKPNKVKNKDISLQFNYINYNLTHKI